MKNIRNALFIGLLVISSSVFAESLTLDNQTSYPKNQKSKMMVQWASTAQEVDSQNKALMYGSTLSQSSLQPVAKAGKVTLNAPSNAQYFRVLVWSKSETNPDLHTNWVNIVPNKTYNLKTDQLVPSVLMSGTGC